MTPAEFDTRRRLLGLSIQEAADFLGVQRRTVERWISGYSEIPDSAIKKLDSLNAAMMRAVDQAVKFAKRKPAQEVALLRYRSQEAVDASPHAAGLPLGAHAVLIGRILTRLREDGFNVTVNWGD